MWKKYFLYFLISLFTVVLILFFQPRLLLGTVELIIPGVSYFSKTDKPIIALTIDDVTNKDTTQLILDTLKENTETKRKRI